MAITGTIILIPYIRSKSLGDQMPIDETNLKSVSIRSGYKDDKMQNRTYRHTSIYNQIYDTNLHICSRDRRGEDQQLTATAANINTRTWRLSKLINLSQMNQR